MVIDNVWIGCIDTCSHTLVVVPHEVEKHSSLSELG